MKRIRIGKDISMRWEITTDGVAIPLEGRDLTVEIKSHIGIVSNIPYRVDGNSIIMTYYGAEQKRVGEYSITLWENKGKPGQNVVDVIRAFELVRTSQEENDFVGGDLQIESVDLGTENFDILTEGGYRAINIDTLHAEALEDSVNIKGKTYSNESFTITLPKANLDSAGVMSPEDKQTLQKHGNSISQLESTTNAHSNAISQINAKLDEHTESINANITTDRIEDGSLTSEKIATSAFDSTLSVSGKIAPADVVGGKLTELKEKIDVLALGAFYGYFPDSASLPTDVTTLGYAYVGLYNPYKIWNFNGESWSDSGTSINMNDADEEDITRNTDGKLQFKNRVYGDGMGYVVLRKDKAFAEQVIQENTIYEIRYDFDLGGGEVEIPNNCILKFYGGKLSNGSIKGNFALEADAVTIFDNINIIGNVNTEFAKTEWFDDNINICCKYFEKVRLSNKTYQLQSLIIDDDYKVEEIFGVSKEDSMLVFSDDGIILNKRVFLHNFSMKSALNSNARTNGNGVLIHSGEIKNISIYAFKCGINLNEEKVIVSLNVSDCGISYCRTYGIYNKTATNIHDGVRIRNNYITGIGSSTYNINTIDAAQRDSEIGICVDGGLNIDISNNVIEYCNGAGIRIKSDSSTLSGITVFNNYSENNKYCGFFYEHTKYPISHLTSFSNRGILDSSYKQTGSTGISGVLHNIGYGEISNYIDKNDMLQALRSNYEQDNKYPYDNFVTSINGPLYKHLSSKGLEINKGDFPDLQNITFKLNTSKSYYLEAYVVNEDADSGHRLNIYSFRKSNGSIVSIGFKTLKAGINYIPINRLDETNGKCYCAFTDTNDGKFYLQYIRVYEMTKATNIDDTIGTMPSVSNTGNIVVHQNSLLCYIDDSWKKVIATENVLLAGTSANRPHVTTQGFQFFDTTLNKPIWWTGTAWVDATGADV